MLSAFLPGLRHVRAPLVAGALWAIGLWVMFEPLAPDAEQASGVYASLLSLVGVLSPIERGVCIVFAVYILGAVSESIFGKLVPAISMSRAWSGNWTAAESESYRLAAFLPSLTASDVFDTGRRSEFSSRAAESLFALVERKVSVALRRLEEAGIDPDEIVEPIFRSTWLSVGRAKSERPRPYGSPSGLRGLAVDPSEVLKRRLVIAYCGAVSRDLDRMATQLIGREDDLFAAIDRHRAEADLRLAMMPPVLAVMVRIGWEGTGWWCVGVLLLIVLWDQATHAVEAGTDLIVDAIVLDRLTVPELERLSNLQDYVRASLDEPLPA